MTMRDDRNILRQKKLSFWKKKSCPDRKKETRWLMQEESEDKKECDNRKKNKKTDSEELGDV